MSTPSIKIIDEDIVEKLKKKEEVSSLLIPNNDDFYNILWEQIDNSRSHFFLVTYDMDNQLVSNVTLNKLIDAANRGVQIVIIVEFLNFWLKRKEYKELKQKGAIFIRPNPMTLILNNIYNGKFSKTFSRFHQKLIISDDSLIVGSLNHAAEYTGIKYGKFQYMDCCLILKNSPCISKAINFFREVLEDHLYQIKDDISLSRVKKIFSMYKNNSEFEKTKPAYSDLLLEEMPPYKSEIQNHLFEELSNAKESIKIVQAYYLRIPKIERILLDCLERGVKVDIVTTMKRDQLSYRHFTNYELFEKLLNKGATIHEVLDKSFHGKAYLIDDKTLTIGSFNNDVTSFIMNSETNCVLHSEFSVDNQNVMKDLNDFMVNLKLNSRPIFYPKKKTLWAHLNCYFWGTMIYLMEKTIANRFPLYK